MGLGTSLDWQPNVLQGNGSQRRQDTRQGDHDGDGAMRLVHM